MPRKIYVAAVLMLISISSIAQYKAQNKSLDAFIERGIADWQIPGLATVVVKDGEVVFKKGFGVTNLKSQEKVNGQTLFAMASTTKAFIAISLGMLVDEGKLDWDDKVIDHYPEFRLSDPYITDNARIRDLLTHNLGLGRDGNRTDDDATLDETIKAYRNADIDYPIRGGWSYQNLMYVIAGEVIDRVSGISWDEFVRTRILKPLGMNRTYTNFDQMKAGNDWTGDHSD